MVQAAQHRAGGGGITCVSDGLHHSHAPRRGQLAAEPRRRPFVDSERRGQNCSWPTGNGRESRRQHGVTLDSSGLTLGRQLGGHLIEELDAKVWRSHSVLSSNRGPPARGRGTGELWHVKHAVGCCSKWSTTKAAGPSAAASGVQMAARCQTRKSRRSNPRTDARACARAPAQSVSRQFSQCVTGRCCRAPYTVVFRCVSPGPYVYWKHASVDMTDGGFPYHLTGGL